jgi:hypothetical protein
VVFDVWFDVFVSGKNELVTRYMEMSIHCIRHEPCRISISIKFKFSIDIAEVSGGMHHIVHVLNGKSPCSEEKQQSKDN